LIELRFYVPLTQNRSFWRRSSQPISWLSTKKLKQTQQSNHASNTKYTTTQNKPKNQKPGLVASYHLETRRANSRFDAS